MQGQIQVLTNMLQASFLSPLFYFPSFLSFFPLYFPLYLFYSLSFPFFSVFKTSFPRPSFSLVLLPPFLQQYTTIFFAFFLTENKYFKVCTSQGDFLCKKVIVTSGAWTNDVLSSIGLKLPITVTQEQVTYFATPHMNEFTKDRLVHNVWMDGWMDW